MLKKLLCFSFLLTALSSVYSQAGTLDNSFNQGNTGFSNGNGLNYNVYSIAVQPDQKILAGGFFEIYNGSTTKHLVRLNADGTIDNNFNSDSSVIAVSEILIQPNGKILVGGNFTLYGGSAADYITRLNSNGSVDNTFNAAASDAVEGIALQADGKILVSGWFMQMNAVASRYLARLNTDGSTDTSFHVANTINGTVASVVVQPDGKILIGGTFISINGISRKRVARLNSDGTLDTSFDPGTAASTWVKCIALQPDGKILVGGYFISFNGNTYYSIVRLNADGSTDNYFTPQTAVGGSIWSIVVQPDGKILAGGNIASSNNPNEVDLLRFNSDGTQDLSFNTGGAGSDTIISCIALQADGNILVGGDFKTYNGTGIELMARIIGDSPNVTHENLSQKEMSIYPNPSTGIFTLQSDEIPQNILVFDKTGRIILSQTPNNNSTSIDLSKYAADVYFIQVKYNDLIEISKAVMK